MVLEFNARRVETDQLGVLRDPAVWDRELAALLAARANIELSTDHWCMIEFVRDGYEARQAVPEVRRLLKAMRERLGEDKATRRYLHKLFPYGTGCSCARSPG